MHLQAEVKRLREELDTQTKLGASKTKPPSLARFLPVFQYLLTLASGVWVLEWSVLTSREA